MNKRVPERIHTRKIDRKVAKNNMLKVGYTRICHRKKKDGGKKGDSYFSLHWREHTA